MSDVYKMLTNGAEIEDEYFHWLCNIVKPLKKKKEQYSFLLSFLHSQDFWWIIDRDENRAKDGKKLRKLFIDEMCHEGVLYSFIEGPCTFLEMLIGLAMRIETDIMYDPDNGDRTSVWFWEMCDNSGLTAFPDSTWMMSYGQGQVGDILNTIMSRKIGKRGEKGLFPLKESKKNQKKVELWYQANSYFQEKFFNEVI